MLRRMHAPRPSDSMRSEQAFLAILAGRAVRFGAPGVLFFAAAAFVLVPQLTAQVRNADGPRFVVVLDAAHGGDDAGASLSDNQTEKAYTLALSVRLRSLLMARGIPVVTTREADTTVAADQRAEIANRANAQACLSLHASESGSGVHLFVSSLAPVQGARFLPWKTAQAAWVLRSLSMAGVINSALGHAGMSVTLGRTALPAIDSMACPAVAVEVAPERGANAQGTEGLDDPSYQARVAEALAAAMVEWRQDAIGGRQP
jgi:N-acetylmuramoyl-L-alanine amidase